MKSLAAFGESEHKQGIIIVTGAATFGSISLHGSMRLRDRFLKGNQEEGKPVSRMIRRCCFVVRFEESGRDFRGDLLGHPLHGLNASERRLVAKGMGSAHK